MYALYRVLGHKLQNRMLLVASYVFYGAWDWRYLSLILISTYVDFFCGNRLEKNDDPRKRKMLVSLSVFANLLILGTFKYFDFFSRSFQELLGHFGISITPILLNVVLPVGISFYTFQTMSYTIDVYRRKLHASRNFFDFALYVSFFPQLVAGPIERGTRLLPQVLQPRQVTWEMMHRGFYLVLWGLFLKVVIGDNMARLVDPIFAGSPPYNGTAVLIAVYAFSFQIYADFAGYSFMAIGLANTMGFTLMENFRRPYFSKNISEFWRRWHISLSSWFRDYFFAPFYIAMNNSKYLSAKPMMVRHTIAFFLTLMFTEYMLGLWHGAGWNFGLFGLYHGLMIWIYYYTKNYWDRLPAWLQIFLMFQLVCGGWLVFRSDNLSQLSDMATSIVMNLQFRVPVEYVYDMMKVSVPLMIMLVVQVFQNRTNDSLVVLRWPAYLKYPFYWMLIFLIVSIGRRDQVPFLYFQF